MGQPCGHHRTTQWEKFFETTAIRRRKSLATSNFDGESLSQNDVQANSFCDIITKLHLADDDTANCELESDFRRLIAVEMKSVCQIKFFELKLPSIRRRNVTSFRLRKSTAITPRNSHKTVLIDGELTSYCRQNDVDFRRRCTLSLRRRNEVGL